MTANIASGILPDGYTHAPVDVVRFFDIQGYKFFLSKTVDIFGNGLEDTYEYYVTDYDSGFRAGIGDTEDEAIKDATDRFTRAGVAKYIAARDKAIAEYGKANP